MKKDIIYRKKYKDLKGRSRRCCEKVYIGWHGPAAVAALEELCCS